jgi:hypothetical protein
MVFSLTLDSQLQSLIRLQCLIEEMKAIAQPVVKMHVEIIIEFDDRPSLWFVASKTWCPVMHVSTDQIHRLLFQTLLINGPRMHRSVSMLSFLVHFMLDTLPVAQSGKGKSFPRIWSSCPHYEF